MSELGVGIVGAGGIFEAHARALAEHADRARIVAVCDVDPQRLARAAAAHQIPLTCQHHAELVTSPDVDLVVVCTPPSLHEPVVLDALAAGKRVVCEKPLAHTLAGADRIIEAARGYPGALSVAYQFRFLPEVRRARWLRDRGALGTLLSGRFHRFARFHRPGRPQRSGWWGRWDVAGGGVVMTQLIHELDLMCLMFGTPARVWGVVDTLKESIESEDTCSATIRFANGAICSCQSTMCGHRSTAGFDVFGSAGSVHSPGSFECLDRECRETLRREALDAVPDHPPGSRANDHSPYLSAVLDAMMAGQPLPSEPEQARRSLELATAIYASSLLDEAVQLPLDCEHTHYHGIEPREYLARVETERGVAL